MSTSKLEAHWVLRAQSADREALECLIRSVQPSLHRYLMGLVGVPDADDVLQEVLILICRKLGCLHTPELFRAWVFRVASRAAFRHLKKKRGWAEQPSGDSVWLKAIPAPTEPPAGMLEHLLEMDGILPASRAVLALHFQHELSLPEVAAILGIPLGTVKSRLAAGLAALRSRFGTRRNV